MVVQNTTAYTWDWYCHLVGDRASLLDSRIFLYYSLLSLIFFKQLFYPKTDLKVKPFHTQTGQIIDIHIHSQTSVYLCFCLWCEHTLQTAIVLYYFFQSSLRLYSTGFRVGIQINYRDKTHIKWCLNS